MAGFKELNPKDNFYQTSLFYPMPLVLITTLTDDGKTNIGPYSLVFPYYIAGKEYYAFLLLCRNSSNTAQNILRSKKCALNFIPDDKKYFKEAVRMGWPGDSTDEKMKGCIFTLVDGLRQEKNKEEKYPKVVKEAFQVVECTWDDSLDNAEGDKPGELSGYKGPFHNFNGITSPYGAHFILKIDDIMMDEKYWNSIVNGVKKNNFPRVPVDYGYRDSKNFWCSSHKAPNPELLPVRETTVDSVRYAAKRLQTDVEFTDEALAMLVNVPRIFLPLVLKGCVKWAEENGCKLITPVEMKEINDKRSKEKKNK